jgi:two-component system response regulator DesR
MLSVKILLAEDVHMVRGALIALLELEPDFEVIASVDRGDLIVETALRTRPDVAILDIDLPGMDGITAATQLHEQLPTCRVLILTSLGRPGMVRRALSAHVCGFLHKDAPPYRLAHAVRSVAVGERVVDPSLALSAWEAVECPLSPREAEVLQLASCGADTAEIAKALYLTQGTVRNYLTAIVAKLNARNRLDAVRIAKEADWIP